MASDDLEMRVQGCKFRVKSNAVWVQAKSTSSMEGSRKERMCEWGANKFSLKLDL